MPSRYSARCDANDSSTKHPSCLVSLPCGGSSSLELLRLHSPAQVHCWVREVSNCEVLIEQQEETGSAVHVKNHWNGPPKQCVLGSKMLQVLVKRFWVLHGALRPSDPNVLSVARWQLPPCSCAAPFQGKRPLFQALLALAGFLPSDEISLGRSFPLHRLLSGGSPVLPHA